MAFDSYVEKLALDFVNEMPPGTNAYLATAHFLHGLTQPPPVSPWANWLGRSILFTYFVMLYQAGYLLYSRMRARKTQFVGFNMLGLIKFDFINVSGAACFVFSALTIANMIFREVIHADRHDQSSQIFLLGTRYLVLLINSWAFWWICLCHCILTARKTSGEDPINVGIAMASAKARMMNGAFLISILGPMIVVIWTFYRANDEYIKATAALNPVIKSLLHLAPTFSPETYNKLQIMARLVTAKEASPHVDACVHYVRIGLFTYLITVSILCLIYLPVLVLTFRGLSDRTAFGKQTRGQRLHVDSEGATERLQFFQALQRQQKAVGLQASLVYIIALSFIPALIWSLSYSGQEQVYSSSWWAILEIGLQGPVAIVANLCLFLLHGVGDTTSPRSLQEASLVVCLSKDKMDNAEEPNNTYLLP